MDVKVVDASAIAAVVFEEPEAAAMAQRIAGVDLVAPPLIELELANFCLVKMRQRPEERVGLRRALLLRAHLKIEHLDVNSADALDLAETARLTVYDASYLWLARDLGAELVTLDRRLAAAAVS